MRETRDPIVTDKCHYKCHEKLENTPRKWDDNCCSNTAIEFPPRASFQVESALRTRKIDRSSGKKNERAKNKSKEKKSTRKARQKCWSSCWSVELSCVKCLVSLCFREIVTSLRSWQSRVNSNFNASAIANAIEWHWH